MSVLFALDHVKSIHITKMTYRCADATPTHTKATPSTKSFMYSDSVSSLGNGPALKSVVLTWCVVMIQPLLVKSA